MGFSSDRVAAIARLAVMLVTAVLGGFGLTVDGDSLFTVVMCAAAAAAAVWSWWKNNNLTKAAQDAQSYLDAIKAMKSIDKEG